jgi:hypothetical protein
MKVIRAHHHRFSHTSWLHVVTCSSTIGLLLAAVPALALTLAEPKILAPSDIAVLATPLPKCFPLTTKVNGAAVPIEEVEIRVTGQDGTLRNAFGWGAHFSTVPNENGYGGGHSECHLNFVNGQNLAMCYDGVRPLPYAGAQNNFRMDLGPALDANKNSLLRDVTFLLTRRAVKVRATRIARGPTTEAVPYVVESTFPMREYSSTPTLQASGNTSGFWDFNKQICIELDGPIAATTPPTSDVLALDNVFTTGSPYGIGPSPLTAYASEGILGNNTAPCTLASLTGGDRCGSGFVVNMIMKQ